LSLHGHRLVRKLKVNRHFFRLSSSLALCQNPGPLHFRVCYGSLSYVSRFQVWKHGSALNPILINLANKRFQSRCQTVYKQVFSGCEICWYLSLIYKSECVFVCVCLSVCMFKINSLTP
jgi:hypothetical protein